MACRRYGSTPTRRCTRTWPSTPGWASRRPGADSTGATGASSCASGFADGASGWFAAGPIPIHPTSGKGRSRNFGFRGFSEVLVALPLHWRTGGTDNLYAALLQRGEDEHADHVGLEGVRVRDAARCGDEHTGGGLVCLVADVERDLTFQQVERLVFPAVNVTRRLGALGRQALYQAVLPAGLLRVGKYGEEAPQIPHGGLRVCTARVLCGPFGFDRHVRSPSVGARFLSAATPRATVHPFVI